MIYLLARQSSLSIYHSLCHRKIDLAASHRRESQILDLAPEEECEHEMFAVISQKGRHLAIPLAQVVPVDFTAEQTKEAVADWHYWIAQGYEL